jgi:ribulose-5-phosphate 4-epimerase/fuculose-1-phosphate aldolase
MGVGTQNSNKHVLPEEGDSHVHFRESQEINMEDIQVEVGSVRPRSSPTSTFLIHPQCYRAMPEKNGILEIVGTSPWSFHSK